jgi:hypothetical protein
MATGVLQGCNSILLTWTPARSSCSPGRLLGRLQSLRPSGPVKAASLQRILLRLQATTSCNGILQGLHACAQQRSRGGALPRLQVRAQEHRAPRLIHYHYFNFVAAHPIYKLEIEITILILLWHTLYKNPSSATACAHGATTALAAGGGTGSQAGEPNVLELATPAVDQPRVVKVRPARRASERPLTRKLEEEVACRPAREVELRLSPASAPARMMNILEAEGGTKIAAWLAPPHPEAGGRRLG